MTAGDLAGFLALLFGTHRFPPDDPNGLWHGSTEKRIERVGLALAPPENLRWQVEHHGLDALWLHRP